ncbi:hypothetical protein E4U55_000377 [Claviceps digitariae]|nr:hypothetical protein E4U55_000377 [Claviceps digitariae]
MPVVLRKRKAPAPPPAPVPPRKKAARPAAEKKVGAEVAGKKAVKAAPLSKAAKTKAAAVTAAAARKKEKEETKEDTKEDKNEDKKEDKKEEKEKDQKKEVEVAEKKDVSPAVAVSPAPAATVTASKKVAVGDVIDLDEFGGEVETNDGKKTSLKELVEKSGSGVVLFTYPKASTPGCTNQVCLFRDAYTPLTADGLAIYGLSADSPKANTTFKTKHNLPYPLLCDPKATLIAAIGLKKHPKGTQRGVFVVDKKGKVLVAEPGGPAGTVDRVKSLVEELGK